MGEIEDAYLWYENKQPNLGILFEEYVDSLISSILLNPYQFQIKYRNIRICYMKKFPYGIHYEIFEHQIQILSVFHTSRFPKP